MFLSCHVRISEWIHTLQLPGCWGTPCSKQARNLKFKWLQLDSNPEPLSSSWNAQPFGQNWPNDWAVFWVLICTVQLIILVSLAKSLSVPWRTKRFWVRVQLQSFAFFSYTIMTYLKKLNGTKSLNKKQCTPGLSPRIIPGYLPFYQNAPFFDMLLCCTHQVWNVSPSPKPSWKTIRIGRNPTQKPNIYSFPPPEKSPSIDLHLPLSKVSSLPYKIGNFM